MRWELGAEQRAFLVHSNSMALDHMAIRDALHRAGLTKFYPDFDPWFLRKVVPGIRSGERQVLASVFEGTLAGVAICKRTLGERKLCTLWVSPQARGGGIAAKLSEDAFAWLGTRKPLFTIPEERIDEFKGLLRFWSFQGPTNYNGLYRNDRVEHVFNGTIFNGFH